jgi:hypothetical protein
MSKTHSVSGARRIERVAAAMFGSQWPPSHPEDLAWWLTRAEAAINAMKES